jgi:predicted RNase H-like nuclease (RuvC/YqgF family)
MAIKDETVEKLKKENKELRDTIKRLEDGIDKHNNTVNDFQTRLRDLLLEALSAKDSNIYRW